MTVASARPALSSSPAPSSAVPKPPRFTLLTDLELEQLPPIRFLVDGVLPAAGFGAIYGAPGAGKSFLALDLACSVAVGCDWLGRPAVQGRAVYVAAEGSAGLKQRLGAWKAHQGLAGHSIPLHFLTEPANLLTPADSVALLEAMALLPTPPALIIIDTLHRSMPGGDENSAKDVGLVIEHAERLRRRTGAAVLLVHHTAKGSDLERGSSSLRGGVDALLYTKADEGRRELRCEKAKDWAPFEPIPFRLLPVGDSCIVQASETAGSSGLGTLSTLNRTALTVLSRDFLDDGATATEWLRASGLNESSFYRSRTALVRGGYVLESKRGNAKRYTLTDSGRFHATPNSHATPSPLPTAPAKDTPILPLPFRGGSDGSRPSTGYPCRGCGRFSYPDPGQLCHWCAERAAGRDLT